MILNRLTGLLLAILLLAQPPWRPEEGELRYWLNIRPTELDAIVTYALNGPPLKACIYFYTNGEETLVLDHCWKGRSPISDIEHLKLDYYNCDCYAVVRTETVLADGRVRVDMAFPIVQED